MLHDIAKNLNSHYQTVVLKQLEKAGCKKNLLDRFFIFFYFVRLFIPFLMRLITSSKKLITYDKYERKKNVLFILWQSLNWRQKR